MLNIFGLWFRNFSVWLFRTIGSEIHDCQTGALLGRGLLIPWKGKIHLLGVDDLTLIPVPLEQTRITYWHQVVGFTQHSEPDFPRVEPAASLVSNSASSGLPTRVLLVILDHRTPAEVEATIRRWLQHGVREADTLLAYGGDTVNFDRIPLTNKIFTADPRLRTSDHQREAQSYRAVFCDVSDWLKSKPFTHILFMEFDHVAVSKDPVTAFMKAMVAKDADVLCHQLQRIDGTTHPHWLASPKFPTRRNVVLSMLGTGHLWKREAWEAVADSNLFADWYLELDLPTTAFELGFRVMGLPEQAQFVVNSPENLSCSPADALAAGAWTLHPVKISPLP